MAGGFAKMWAILENLAAKRHNVIASGRYVSACIRFGAELQLLRRVRRGNLPPVQPAGEPGNELEVGRMQLACVNSEDRSVWRSDNRFQAMLMQSSRRQLPGLL